MIAVRLITACMVALLAAPLYATACTKVDYVEAKDWPVEELERAYCEANKGWLASIHAAAAAATMREANTILAIGDRCFEQQELFGRVLKNVHKRPIPACS